MNKQNKKQTQRYREQIHGLEGVLLRLLSYSQLRSGNVQMIIHENDRYLLGNQI